MITLVTLISFVVAVVVVSKQAVLLTGMLVVLMVRLGIATLAVRSSVGLVHLLVGIIAVILAIVAALIASVGVGTSLVVEVVLVGIVRVWRS